EEKGYFVTGSDKMIYPPMSTYARGNSLKLELGFKEEHLNIGYYKNKYSEVNYDELPNRPDLVLAGTIYSSTQNVEYNFALKNHIPIKSFAQMLEENVVKENSIVVTGSYGKTSTTSMLVKVFEDAGFDPSYMFGGISKDFEHNLKITPSDWSIVEGDEYPADKTNLRSKFFYYKAKYAILTSAAWDHTDIFKTEKEFVDNFIEFVKEIPEDGMLIANLDGKNVEEVIKSAKCKVYTYSKSKPADYILSNVERSDPDHFEIGIKISNGEEVKIISKLLGDFYYENMAAAFIMAHKLGIHTDVILRSLETYSGIKRRLEIIRQTDQTILIDDFASTPEKIKGSLQALKQIYPEYKITLVFEPNSGNRTKEAEKLFAHIFDKADEVILPRFRTVKLKSAEQKLGSDEFTQILQKSNNTKITQISNDEKLVNYLIENKKSKELIVFMGSSGFRGMRQQTANRL
ncbi:hypothetical protein KC660_00395, partial [Candidatus Dojkabacteria bacterium]|nr:hypothetical protein [Candidatus Dojkabacteria bacterium]